MRKSIAPARDWTGARPRARIARIRTFLQPVLYHVNPRDAVVFAGVIATLAIASLVASFLPARRVTKIDPVLALSERSKFPWHRGTRGTPGTRGTLRN